MKNDRKEVNEEKKIRKINIDWKQIRYSYAVGDTWSKMKEGRR